jgi:hypothetical protein
MLEDFFAKIAGKFVSNKLNLQEDKKMDDSKKWYQSKTIWTGIITGLLALYNSIAPGFHIPAVPEWVYAFLGALGVYTRATATTTIE